MKLSEAIVLGDTLKRANPWVWISHDCTQGCAIGGAMLAVGRWKAPLPLMDGVPAIRAVWPWLAEKTGSWGFDYLMLISEMYVKVCAETRSFESLVQWVKDHEPECGECNCFECICGQPVPETVLGTFFFGWRDFSSLGAMVFSSQTVFEMRVAAHTAELVSTE